MDKTGTLTANRIHYSDVLPIGIEKAELLRILGEFAHSASTSNKTSEAIAAALPGEKRALIDEVLSRQRASGAPSRWRAASMRSARWKCLSLT